MGEIRKRGGVYWIRYYRDGRRIEESAKTERMTLFLAERARLGIDAPADALSRPVDGTREGPEQ